MKTIYAVVSTVLHRPVFISEKAVAEKFAATQTEHTDQDHVVEPVELHDDATKLDERIDAALRASTIAGMTAGQRRALGIELPAPAKPAAPVEPEVEA